MMKSQTEAVDDGNELESCKCQRNGHDGSLLLSGMIWFRLQPSIHACPPTILYVFDPTAYSKP